MSEEGGKRREKQASRVTLTRFENVDERRIIRARRDQSGDTSGLSFETVRACASPAVPNAEMLRDKLEHYRNALDFDLTSRVPVLGLSLTLLERFIRSLLPFYIDRQAAFNQCCQALFASTNDQHSRRRRGSLVRVERREENVAKLEDLVDSLSIELRSRGAEAFVIDRAAKTSR